MVIQNIDKIARMVPLYHSDGTVRIALLVPPISLSWYHNQEGGMGGVKRCA